MSKQLEVNHQSLLDAYYDYYTAKLASREHFENINKIDNEQYDYEHFEINKEAEQHLKDSYEPIKNLLFLFRGNYDYIVSLVSILDEKIMNDSIKNNSLDSLIDLFCHQFYDNILIPNPEQEELLILCYRFIQREIEAMNSASVDSFLEESFSFSGKFLKSFTKKTELKTFLSKTLGDLILEIDNVNKFINLNPYLIRNYLKKREGSSKVSTDKSKEDTDLDPNVLKSNIPQTTIVYKVPCLDLVEKDPDDEDSSSRKSSCQIVKDTNLKYFDDLNQAYLIDKVKETKDQNLKEFYFRQLERINKNPDIFSNNKLMNLVEDSGPLKHYILKEYKNNFLFIREKIDEIIQILMDKIEAIPYTVRCLCKIIFCLIDKKFPKISRFEKNAFIGEFIFGKCILPILINSDINAVITTNILRSQTRSILKNIAKILIKINRGELFDESIDTGFTVFNHYILEVIPLMGVFYEKLIDVELPRVLNEIIISDMNRPMISSFKRARMRRKAEKENTTITPQQQEIQYDYFKENPEESINIQCTCFSIQDIIFLYEVIHSKIDRFKHLPKYIFFQKTIDKIGNEIPKLAKESKMSEKKRPFFIVFKEFINKDYNVLKNPIQYSLTEDPNNNTDIVKRVQFCIKTILKGLNLINNKDYAYLNFATSNYQFLRALNYTLNELEDDTDVEVSKQIPLKWYAQYIMNNKSLLPIEYKQNDYSLLYSTLLDEEKKALSSLKEHTSTVFAKNGMNNRCAEKIIEKAKRDAYRVDKVKRFMKMQKFAKKTKIEACISVEVSENESSIDNQSGFTGFFQKLIGQEKEKENDKKPIDCKISVIDGRNCIHKKVQMIHQVTIQTTEGGKDQSSSNKDEHHADKIAEFIEKVIQYGKKGKYLQADVISGTVNNKMYKTIEDYLVLVKENLNASKIFEGDTEEQKNITLERIEDHIMKQLYSESFPQNPLPQDTLFYEITSGLSDIQPNELGIKTIYANELNVAVKCIKKLDSGKSVYEKLNCIASAYNTINNTLKFSSGKDSDGGAEDLSPIFQYIIIKAKPDRFYSNINYIKTFLNPSKTKGVFGFLLSQLDFAAEFITKLYQKKKESSDV